MEKVIKIDGQEIKIKACASTAIRYQQVFGEHIDNEIFKAVSKGAEEYNGGIYESAGRLLYIMAWHCNPQDLILDKDAAMAWLDSIGTLSPGNLKEIIQLFFRK